MTAWRFTGYAPMILCLCLVQRYCYAQDKSKVQLGKVSPADFILPSSPIIDSNANAIILSDVGTIHFIGNEHSWFSHVYQRQTRIRILNKKAFNLATVVIPLYRRENDWEKVDKVMASAFNLENGQVVETKLEKTELFENRLNLNWVEEKFTLPAVKEGSIIEYTYTVTSDFDYLPSWEFQRREYPCLWSEYQVKIPQALLFVLVKQGVHAYAVDKGSEGTESYSMSRPAEGLAGEAQQMVVSANTVMHRWVMKEIPAFREERFLSTPENYLDKIDFQLAKTYDGQEYHDHKNSWKQATSELLTEEDFGGPLDAENNMVSETVQKVIAGNSDLLEQAKSIYYYVASHFTCDNYYNKYIKTNFRDVMKKSSGTVGDINLLLIAMLRKAGLQADPVVLSTREFGYNLASYPVLQKLNYVIARVRINDRIYYLDAAHSQLGFGQLAGNCYNGHARIISNKDSGSVYFDADSLKERKTTLVLITNTDQGLVGSWQSTLGAEESYELRQQVSGQGEKGEKDYFKHIQTGYGDDLEISQGGIDSLSKPDDPVKVHYEFRLHQAEGESQIYLNPMIGEGWHENPFKAAERKYPVEMPYARDDMYIFSMEIPPGYVVDELPKSARVALNVDQGSFEYMVGQQENQIQLRCHLKLNKANFLPDDYATLRDFFSYVVKKENETIVLKKK